MCVMLFWFVRWCWLVWGRGVMLGICSVLVVDSGWLSLVVSVWVMVFKVVLVWVGLGVLV